MDFEREKKMRGETVVDSLDLAAQIEAERRSRETPVSRAEFTAAVDFFQEQLDDIRKRLEARGGE